MTATTNLALPNSSSVTITGNLKKTSTDGFLNVSLAWRKGCFNLTFLLHAVSGNKVVFFLYNMSASLLLGLCKRSADVGS